MLVPVDTENCGRNKDYAKGTLDRIDSIASGNEVA